MDFRILNRISPKIEIMILHLNNRYTNFSYNNLRISTKNDSASLEIDITNVGRVYGEEVVQLYIQYPSSAQEPPKNLRGFQKVLQLAHSFWKSCLITILALSISKRKQKGILPFE